MKTNPPSHLRARLVAVLAFVTLALGLGQAQAYDRIFNLTLTNGLNVPVTWTIHPGSCYEGTGNVDFPGDRVHGPVAPGGSVTLTMARVQGHGCDGEQGKFSIAPSFTYPDIPEGGHGWYLQNFDFTNDGELSETYYPNGYSTLLTSTVTGNRKDYVWTMRDISHRLSGPLDERLTMPRNYVARNFGKWDGGSEDGGGVTFDQLTFRRNGFEGMKFTQCSFIPYFHAQHIVRLPNKNGRAYFAVNNSWADISSWPGVPGRPRGTMSVYRSDSLDPVTDLVPNNPGSDGQIVWEQIYGWNTDQEVPYNPIGSWNHPCKMDVIGGVLIVSMLDWDGNDFCRDGSRIADQDTLIFYDVRDPESPKFWGRMTRTQLGLGRGAKVEDASIVQVGRWWVLYVQGKWWYSERISPTISDWFYGGTGNPGGNLAGGYFNSYERYDLPGEVAPPGTVAPGIERAMWAAGGEDETNEVTGDQRLYIAQMFFDDDQTASGFSPKALGVSQYSERNGLFRAMPDLWDLGPWVQSNPHHFKDYDAAGVTVRKGMLVMYSPLIWYRDDNLAGPNWSDDSIDTIYQVYHPANLALQTPPEPRIVTTNAINEPGGLREAVDHGGTITFADPYTTGDLVGGLEDGPIMVYLHDVQIDASATPNGCKLIGWPDSYGRIAPLIQIAPGLNFSMKNVLTIDDPLAAALNTTQLACATGGHAIWNAQNTVLHGSATLAAQSGDITHDQESYLHSAVEGPGTLTFWWKVSSQSGADYLRFRLDGVEQVAAPAISGDSGWQQKTVSIPAGYHQLRWTYAKDGTLDAGLDAAFLSEVVYTPSPPVITTPLTMNATQGSWTTQNFIAASGSPTSYTASGLPSGLYFQSTKGEIFGSPAVSGVFNVTVTATNAGGTSVPGTMTITIAPTTNTLTQAVDLPVQALPFESYYTSVPFFGQTTTSHDGVDAAQSAVIPYNSDSDLRTYFYGPGTLSFWWRFSTAGGDSLKFTVGDAELPSVPALTFSGGWQFVTVNLPAGAHSVRWVYRNNNFGDDTAWVDEVKFVPSLAQALDTPPITWTTSGDANWLGQMATTLDALAPVPSVHSQRDAAQSGDISHLQSSELQTSVTGPATLTFWWKVSSEASWDFLQFFLDGSEQAGAPKISGEVDWQKQTISIPAGNHTLLWRYSKDSSFDVGADAGWVDQVLLSPPHTITSPLTASATQGTPFSYQITARNSPTHFNAFVDDPPFRRMPPGLSIDEQSGVISGIPTATGVYSIEMEAHGRENNSGNPISSWWGSSFATLVLTIGPSPIPPTAALEVAGATWITSAPDSWLGQSLVVHDGDDALQSAGIGHSESTSIQSTFTGPGRLSFWWKVSSQPIWDGGGDVLAFEMDGVQLDGVPPIAGEVDWEQKFVVIPPGEHTLSWSYRKDAKFSMGADAGWVDNIQFVPSIVTTLADSGPGSLRQIMADVADGGTVTFDPALDGETISLGSELLVSGTDDVTIDASMLQFLRITGGPGSHRMFTVLAGGKLDLRGVYLDGGDGDGTPPLDSGGAVLNKGTAALTDCTIADNRAVDGTGVLNLGGTMTLLRCTINRNGQNGLNPASGGVNNFDGTLDVINCTISDNPGGIWNQGTTTISNSTVTGNSQHLANTTGGVRNHSGTLTVSNSIIAGNTGATADVSGVFSSGGYNLIGIIEGSTGFGATGDKSGTTAKPLNAKLGPLGINAGPTQTHALLAGSPAINAGSSSTLTTDQRGQPHVGVPDIGAYEVQAKGVFLIDNASTPLNYAPAEGSPATITIRRAGGFMEEGRVRLITSPGAAAAADFTGRPNTTASEVIFPPGVDSMLVTVNTTVDSLVEANESFTVKLGTPSAGSTIGTPSSATVTIVDASSLASTPVTGDTAIPSAPLINTPANNASVGAMLTDGILVTGTASDNKGVESVQIFDSNGVSLAVAELSSPRAKTTTWRAIFVPGTGLNVIKARSTDLVGNPSAFSALRTFKVLRPLAVNIAGVGTMTAGYAPSSYREVGRPYTITSTAGKGALFAGWSVLSGQPLTELGTTAAALENKTITVIHREGLALRANFVPNPYVASTIGVFSGAVTPDPTLPDRAPMGSDAGEDGTPSGLTSEGAVTLTVTTTGGFSGKLRIDGLTLNMSGTFDHLGAARFGTARAQTLSVARANKPTLNVTLSIDINAKRITGILLQSDQGTTVAVSHLNADRTSFTAANPVPTVPFLATNGANGIYTMALEPGNGVTPLGGTLAANQYPKGFGYGTVTLTKTGGVKVAGMLADKTTITMSTTMSQSGTWRLFVQPYPKSKGLVAGNVAFNHADAATDLQALDTLWVCPPMDREHYPLGWTDGIHTDLVGSKYTVTTGTSVLPLAQPTGTGNGNANLSFVDGLLPLAIQKQVDLGGTDAVTEVPVEATYNLIINRKTGVFSGTFTHNDGTKPTFNGVILQKNGTGGRGFFLTTQPKPKSYLGQSGGASLIPQ